MKKFLLILLFVILIGLVAFPKESIEAGTTSVQICLYTIIPTLLPFFVVSNIMVSAKLLDGVMHLFAPITRRLFGLGGDMCFVYLTSSLSGYPTGAKLTADLYRTRQLSHDEAQRIALFSQVTGPAFMTVVASSLLNLPSAFIYILLSHHFAMGILSIGYTIIFKRPKHEKVAYDSNGESKIKFSSLLNHAILSSVKTLALICCLVIFFYVLTALIDRVRVIDSFYQFIFNADIKNTPLEEIVFGLLEMTLGCIKVSDSVISINQKIAICCGLLSFGGLSIFFQAKTILDTANIKTKGLFVFKLCHGLLAYLLSSLMLNLYPLKIQTANFSYIIKAISFSYLYLPLILLVYIIFKFLRRN